MNQLWTAHHTKFEKVCLLQWNDLETIFGYTTNNKATCQPKNSQPSNFNCAEPDSSENWFPLCGLRFPCICTSEWSPLGNKFTTILHNLSPASPASNFWPKMWRYAACVTDLHVICMHDFRADDNCHVITSVNSILIFHVSHYTVRRM